MTFNLRYDKPDPGNLAWKQRQTAVSTLLHQYTPDLVGTQEGKPHQLLDLHRLLPHYQSIGGDRTGRSTDEYCAIFYHPQRLRCLNTGDFWLSNTPEIPGSVSSEWGNPLPRMVTWGTFQGIDTPQTITVFNTHLDYRSQAAREYSAQLIWQRMGMSHAAESFLILTADFNAKPGTATRQTFCQPLKNGVQLKDALAAMNLTDQMTFHDFTGQGFDAIDTIYYDSRCRLKCCKIDTAQYQDTWPSDHFPVIAELELI